MKVTIDVHDGELSCFVKMGYLENKDEYTDAEVISAIRKSISDNMLRSNQYGFAFSFEVEATEDIEKPDEYILCYKGFNYTVYTNDFKDYYVQTSKGAIERLHQDDWGSLRTYAIDDNTAEIGIKQASAETRDIFIRAYSTKIYECLQQMGAGQKATWMLPNNPDIFITYQKDNEMHIEEDSLYGGSHVVDNCVIANVMYKGIDIGSTDSMNLEEWEFDLEADNLGKCFYYNKSFCESEHIDTTLSYACMQEDLGRQIYSEWKDVAYVDISDDARYKVLADVKNDTLTVRKEQKNGADFFNSVGTSKICSSLTEAVCFICDNENIVYDYNKNEKSREKRKQSKESNIDI